MNIYILGNILAKGDTVPLQLIPALEKALPSACIESVDPTENFIPEEGSILIDSVEGIDSVCVYDDIDIFVTERKLTVHEYDLGFHLQLLKKLHKLPLLWIIGVPRFSLVENIQAHVLKAILELESSKERKHQSEK